MTGFLREVVRAAGVSQSAAEVRASRSIREISLGMLGTEFRIAAQIAAEDVGNVNPDMYLFVSQHVLLHIQGARHREATTFEIEFVESRESGVYATSWEGVRRTLQDAEIRRLSRFADRYLELLEEWHSES